MAPPSVRTLEDKCLARTNLLALISAATRAKGQSCTLLPQYRAGGTSLARASSDSRKEGSHWIARVQLHELTAESSQGLRVEIDTMAMLRAAGTSVPRVFVSEVDYGDEVVSAFVLIEFFPLDEADKYETLRLGVIPLEYRSTCYRPIAAMPESHSPDADSTFQPRLCLTEKQVSLTSW